MTVVYPVRCPTCGVELTGWSVGLSDDELERKGFDPRARVGRAGIDDDLARKVRAAWKASLDLDTLLARLLAHASDDDPIPAGRGYCQACATFCRGDGTNDRLRSGFCHP